MLGRKRKKAVKVHIKLLIKVTKIIMFDYPKVIYRNIRTNIEYSAVGKNVKAINITSSISNDGQRKEHYGFKLSDDICNEICKCLID